MTTLDATLPAHGRVGAAARSFLAIVERDLLVIRREAPSFLVQTLVQPLFFLFVFGKVLTGIGTATPSFGTILLPGIVAFTCFLTPLQAVSIDLGRDLGFTHEIDDRLLAPLPNVLVALEKFGLAALRGLIAGACVFPLAYLVLGSGYHVRTDLVGEVAGMMVLTALLGAAIGMLVGALDSLRWFQVVTLFNPLTYAAEGLRHAMLPPIAGHPIETLPMGWVLVVLCGSLVVILGAGLRLFRHRVVS
ncbi:MAG: ABC transporter permease [Chloroflexi bacterium]|nr:MAG: ABC transporter permease [Chloroflexota bacterium]